MTKMASKFIMMIYGLVDNEELLSSTLNIRLLKNGTFLVATSIMLLKELLSTMPRKTSLAAPKQSVLRRLFTS